MSDGQCFTTRSHKFPANRYRRTKNSNVAKCEANLGDECLGYNEDSNGVEECLENPDCYIKRVDGGLGRIPFKHLYRPFTPFSICVPKYPVGFYREEDAEDCDLGTIKFFALNPEPVIEILNEVENYLEKARQVIEEGIDAKEFEEKFLNEVMPERKDFEDIRKEIVKGTKYEEIVEKFGKEKTEEYLDHFMYELKFMSMIHSLLEKNGVEYKDGKMYGKISSWKNNISREKRVSCANSKLAARSLDWQSKGTNCFFVPVFVV